MYASIGDQKIHLDIGDGEIIAESMVLARVVRLDLSSTKLVVAPSAEADFIVQMGLVQAARNVLLSDGG